MKPKTREQYQQEYSGESEPNLREQLEIMTVILEQNQESLRAANVEGQAFWKSLVSQNELEIEVIKSYLPATK